MTDSRYAAALEDLRQAGVCADFAVLGMPGSAFPWTDTGIDVRAGDEVTILATGEIANLGLVGRPQFFLWRRVRPGGEVAKGTQDTTSFRADRSGRLELAVCHGEWQTPLGDTATPKEVYDLATGSFDVVAVRWSDGTRAADGLARLGERLGADPLVAAEQARIAAPVPRPDGWRYLWFLGESDTFTEAGAPARIACHTRDDAAILRREIDLATTPDTTLTWRWKIDALPSALPEDALPQHDYLSVAVEWDCGRDLTWFWSSGLPVGTVFTCPIPQWAPRETHVVVRSGAEGLGEWHAESRNLYQDYRSVLGAEPGRIVAVWLIAVSLFQHGEGRAEFESLALASQGRVKTL